MEFDKIYKLLEENRIDTIIIDFDHTLTTYDSETTIGVFSKVLNEHYVQEKKIIDIKTNECKNKIKMLYFWFKKNRLLKKFEAKKYIQSVLKYFKVEQNFKELFKYCNKKNITIIVCSAGYKPLIKEILKQNQMDNVQVIANEENSKVITPLNKSKYIHNKSTKIMVIGDSTSDSKMAKKKSLKVAICNELKEYYKLSKCFDYVILHKFEIVRSLNTSKSKIKIGYYCGTKVFLKSVNDVNKEINRYNLLKKYYKIPDIAIKYKKYVIYNYIEDFDNKKIYDYLYGQLQRIDTETITEQYKRALTETLCIKNELECESKKFFTERTNIIEEYLNTIDFEKIILNNETIDLRTVIQEISNKIKKPKKLHAFITQGDPTDMNITITGYFTDFENAGYNTILSELSIMFISLYSHGAYFYPKYNSLAYITNSCSLNNLKCTLEVDYTLNEKNIYVKKFNYSIGIKNKTLLCDFIDIFLKDKNYKMFKDEFKYLKYYICMRILTPLDINKMDKHDRIVLLILLVKVYNDIRDLESLKEFIGGSNGSI